MPEGHQFLANLALVLGTAGFATVVCRQLKLPVIFGYIVAGMILGPYVPIPLAADEEMVRTLSELGVILLMFALGLEFSLRRLLRIGPTAGVVAVLQSSAMVAIGYLIGRAFGWTPLESVFAGAVIAISSTTIIVKAFHEQRVSGKFTEIVFGILIIEDLIAILLLTILTTFALSGDVTVSLLAGTTGKLALFLVVLIVVGLLVTPRFIRYLVGLESTEMTVVVCVAICFATSYLASSLGYSVALGAFLAGAVIAESGKAEEISHAIEPVRDLFAAIFFVSVGMLIQPSLVAEYWLPIVVTTLAVIVGKVIAVSVGCFLTGDSVRTSVRSGMSLAQIGEFSFIIAGVGLSTGATRPFLYPLAVAVSAITTLTTPWLIRLADPVASFVDRRLPAPLQTIVGLYGSWMQQLREPREPQPGDARRRRVALILVFDAVVLVGLGVGLWFGIGRLAGAVMRGFSISPTAAWVAVLTAGVLVGAPFAVGLVRNLRTLIQLAALKALPAPAKGKVDLALAPRRALMVTWQLAVVVLVGVPLLALAEPIVPIPVSGLVLAAVIAVLGFVFWKTATNLQGHARAGAEVIVAALERELKVPAVGRGNGGITAAGQDQRSLSTVYSMIPGLGEPVSVRIGPDDYAAGKALAEIDLRDLTGATVLVIARGTDNVVLPIGRDIIQAGDVLALAGPADAVAAARQLLVSGPAETDGG